MGALCSDEQGSPYLHRLAGTGAMGMGVGHLIFTLVKPVPVRRVTGLHTGTGLAGVLVITNHS